MAEKPRFVMCICTGECPGFQSLNLWQLVNRVRNEQPDHLYIVGACDPKMQRKMFKDVFAEVGVDFDRQVISLDLRNMSTEDAYNKVAEAVARLT